MFSLLAQRVALRASVLSPTAVLRSRTWPVALFFPHAWVRTFVAAPSPRSRKSVEPTTTEKTSDKPKKKKTASASASKSKITLRAAAPRKRGCPPVKKVGRPRTKRKAPKIPNVPKDQLPPKYPMTPYLRFYVKYRQDHPELRREGIFTSTKAAGIAWRALAPEEKQVYYDEWRLALQDWQKRRKEYYENVNPEIIDALNKRRKARGMTRIASIAKVTGNRAPRSPYLRFFLDYRKEMALNGRGSESKKIASECGERWRAMSDEEKAPYMKSYRVDRDAYNARKAAAASS